MAVAFDSFASNNGTGNVTVSSNPVGTPRGILAHVIYSNTAADIVSSVTYGGVSAKPVTGSPLVKSTTEIGVVQTYLLASAVPTGTKPLVVTRTNTNEIWVGMTVLTADADVVVQATVEVTADTISTAVGTLSLGGATCFCQIGFMSGENAPGSNGAFSGWTERLSQQLATSKSAGVYTYNTVSTVDVSAGFNLSADDAVMFGIAVTESGAASDKTLDLDAAGIASGVAFGTDGISAPLVGGDFQLMGSGASNIGGALGSELVDASLNNLWDDVSSAESGAGDTEYRCVYVRNRNSANSMVNTTVSIQTDPSESDFEIGLGAAGKNSEETAVADEGTAPGGVTFGTASISLGTLAPNDYYAIWIKRIVPIGAGAATPDTGVLRIIADG